MVTTPLPSDIKPVGRGERGREREEIVKSVAWELRVLFTGILKRRGGDEGMVVIRGGEHEQRAFTAAFVSFV